MNLEQAQRFYERLAKILGERYDVCISVRVSEKKDKEEKERETA